MRTVDVLGLMAYLTLFTGRPPERELVSEVLRQQIDGQAPPATPAAALSNRQPATVSR
jgi:hypothetical protein